MRFQSFHAITAICLSMVCWLIAYFTNEWIQLNPLRSAAMYSSFLCMLLVVSQSRHNFVWGGVASILLAADFLYNFDTPMKGLAAAQLLMVPLMVYGFWRWGPDTSTRLVQHIELKWMPAYAVATYAIVAAIIYALHYTQTQIGELHMTIIVLSILGQVLLVEKRIEAWLVWFPVNVVAIYVFSQTNDFMNIVQYTIYLISNVVGYWTWNQTKVRS